MCLSVVSIRMNTLVLEYEGSIYHKLKYGRTDDFYSFFSYENSLSIIHVSFSPFVFHN
jgi:hypothetical protein